jgi:hypothetical protein
MHFDEEIRDARGEANLSLATCSDIASKAHLFVAETVPLELPLCHGRSPRPAPRSPESLKASGFNQKSGVAAVFLQVASAAVTKN